MEMEDPAAKNRSPRQGASGSEVRSRWTPKAEQILILESIFNSGMVNPPKEETVRIRKLLERFGPVGDANVFYWFQNRRSRSRRRQRQIQATLLTDHHQPQSIHQAQASSSSSSATAATLHYDNNENFLGGAGVDDLFLLSQQMDIDPTSIVLGPDFCQGLGSMTVFINGVATQVPRGAFDMRAMFGAGMLLVHSSGIPAPMDEYGLSMLQMGESYFLVSGP